MENFIIRRSNNGAMIIIYEEGKVVDKYYLINGQKIYENLEEVVDDKTINTIKRNLIYLVYKYHMEYINIKTDTYEGPLTPELYSELTK